MCFLSCCCLCFFFFKQKTAYEMRISDWSSDVCSSDLLSNGALWRVVRDVVRLAPRALVLGGGGYNPWTVGRCWAGVWATLNGIEPPVENGRASGRERVWQ